MVQMFLKCKWKNFSKKSSKNEKQRKNENNFQNSSQESEGFFILKRGKTFVYWLFWKYFHFLAQKVLTNDQFSDNIGNVKVIFIKNGNKFRNYTNYDKNIIQKWK